MTQIENARQGIVTEAMKIVAAKESLEPEQIRQLVASGRVVIPCNINHKNLDPIGIGKGLQTKINANIGTSGDFDKLEDELKKIDMVVKYKADTVMDLSTGGDVDRIRRELIRHTTIPFGNVPIYQMAKDAAARGGAFVNMTAAEMLDHIEKQAADGRGN